MQYYINDLGCVSGPYTEEELLAQELHDDTLVREDTITRGEWVPFSRIDWHTDEAAGGTSDNDAETTAWREAVIITDEHYALAKEMVENSTDEQIVDKLLKYSLSAQAAEKIASEVRKTHNERIKEQNGEGEYAVLHKFNWGAFALNGVWGLFNNLVWLFIVCMILNVITLFSFEDNIVLFIISLAVSISLMLYLGFNGNRMAWHRIKDDDPAKNIESFARRQRGWSIAGKIVFSIDIAFAVIEVLSELF